jgi:hypothetical protein
MKWFALSTVWVKRTGAPGMEIATTTLDLAVDSAVSATEATMKRVLLVAVAVVVLVLGSLGDASAGYIGTTATNNDVIGVKEGWYGANLYFSGPANTQVTIDFVGKEAGFTNQFFFNDVLLATTGATRLTTSVETWNSTMLAQGLVQFKFYIQNTGATLVNGANLTPLQTPNFFLSLGSPVGNGDAIVDGVTPTSGNSVIIALDDGPFDQTDDNHDDMVMRLTLSQGNFYVPDGGATAMLLGGALAALGVLRSRFRA